MANPNTLPSTKTIFNWWKNGLENNTKAHYPHNLDDTRFENIWEGDEKTCMCCGAPDMKVERAHIIPKALGGSNECSNLFLLCKDCHKESPDFADSKFFFKWINKQEYYTVSVMTDKTLHDAIQDVVDTARKNGVNFEESGEEILEELKRQLSIASTRANTHGGGMAKSTLVAISVSAVEETLKMFSNKGEKVS